MTQYKNYELVRDARFFPESYNNKDGFILWGSIACDKFIRLPQAWIPVIETLQTESASGGSIVEARKKLSTQDFNFDEFIELLYYKNLLILDGEIFSGKKKDGLARNKNEFTANSKNLFSFRIGVNLSKQHATTVKNIFDFLCILLIAPCLLSSVVNISLIVHSWRFIDISSPGYSIFLLIAGSCISISLHEFGHILSANKHGIKSSRISIRNYLILMNYFSVHLPGIHTLSDKARGEVSFSGPEANILLSEILCIMLFLPAPRVILEPIALFSIINMAYAILNLNPFFDTDGYHIISNFFFKTYDIKSQAIDRLRNKRVLLPQHFIFLFGFFFSRFCLIISTILFSSTIGFSFFRKHLPLWPVTGITILLSFFFIYVQVKTIRLFFKRK